MSEMLSLIQIFVGIATLIVTVWAAARDKILTLNIMITKRTNPPPSDGFATKDED